MQPDLELVHIRDGESFAAWAHGYPFRTVRWHYHPEYEIHLVVATAGKFYIGDHIGDFEPGQLIMTGPNLPQNWISNIPAGTAVPRRTEVIQFSEDFVEDALMGFCEMETLRPLLAQSRRGLLFQRETGQKVTPLMGRIIAARGIRRLRLFCELLDILTQAPEPEALASLSFEMDMTETDDSGVNRAIAFLRENLSEQVDELQLAELTGQSPTAFSRSFKRRTGVTFICYKNQLRIDLACQMLVSDSDARIAEICYAVGYANLSNFNRQFLKLKGMSPSRFRGTFAANEAFSRVTCSAWRVGNSQHGALDLRADENGLPANAE